MKKLLLFIFGIQVLAGWSQTSPVVLGNSYELESDVLQEKREILIYQPVLATETKACQVIYLLDAEWHFGFVSSLVDKMISTGDMPPAMVVGIVNTNRSRDLTPAGTNDNTQLYGGAKDFLRFLIEELKPWVEANFETLPFDILAGHSFGGLFSVYSTMEQPGGFKAYLSLSPSLGRNSEQQLRRAAEIFTTLEPQPAALYLAVGNEGGWTYKSSLKLSVLLEAERSEDFRFKFEHLEAETHESITLAGFIHGLNFIYSGFNPEKLDGLDDLFLVEAHYNELSSRFGHSLQIPEHYYQQFVTTQMGEGEFDYTLFLLGKYREAWPESIAVYRYYGDTYLMMGEFSKAREAYIHIKEAGLADERIERLIRQLK